MKTISLLIIILLCFYQYNLGQIKVKSTGKTIIGPDTTYNIFNLNITGSGTTGSNGNIGFGNNSDADKNVYIGEYLTTNTDKLILHGDQGIHFSTTNATNTRMFLSNSGNLGIGNTNPLASFCVGTGGDVYSKSYFYNSSIADLSRTLQVNQKTDGVDNADQLFGIVSYVDYGSAGSGAKLYGIYSSAYRGSTQRDSRTYGVVGTAGNGYSG